MFGLKDLMALLDRWEVWQRVRETPERLDALEPRIAALEEMLGGKWPPDVCKACGERAVRLAQSMAPIQGGVVRQEWHCSACTRTEVRLVKASG